jgi:hypothetical protein
MNSVVNQIAYLPTSRLFPQDPGLLVVELSKSYIDIATAVNNRIIAIFPTIRPALSGEEWFLSNNLKQQGFRQVYTFTTTTSINHGINFSNISRFTHNYGEFTDGTNWYGLISGSNVAIAGQISFYLTPTQIVFLVGAGAPALTLGNIVLEWISQP